MSAGQPEPAAVVRREPVELTGQAEVDAALELVRGLDDLPVGDQVAVYDEVQRRLAGAIGQPGGAQPGGAQLGGAQPGGAQPASAATPRPVPGHGAVTGRG